jgi:hypothetical protein
MALVFVRILDMFSFPFSWRGFDAELPVPLSRRSCVVLTNAVQGQRAILSGCQQMPRSELLTTS